MRLSTSFTWPTALQPFFAKQQSTPASIAQIRALAWPLADLDEALFQMAQWTGVLSKEEAARLTPGPVEHVDAVALDRWLDVATGQMSMEVETVSASYGEVSHLLHYGAPALVPIYATRQQVLETSTTLLPNFLVLLKGSRWRVTLLGADGAIHQYPTEMVRAAISAAWEIPLQLTIETLLDGMAMPEERRHDARVGLLHEELRQVEIPGFRLLRLTPGNGFWRQVRQIGLTGYLWSSMIT